MILSSPLNFNPLVKTKICMDTLDIYPDLEVLNANEVFYKIWYDVRERSHHQKQSRWLMSFEVIFICIITVLMAVFKFL